MWLLALLACIPDQPVGDDVSSPVSETSTTVTGDTGTPPFTGTGDLDARCEPDPDNALRFLCTVDTDAPTEVTVRAWRPEAPDQVRVIRGSSDEPLLLWGLSDRSTWTWRAEAGGQHRTGQVTTGSLPQALATTWDVLVDESEAQVEGFLAAPSCPGTFLQIVDREGRIVWYQDVAEVLTDRTVVLGPVHRTPEDTILMLVGRTSIVEIDLQGRLLLDLVREQHFDKHVHHDVFRHQGLTWALFVAPVTAGTDEYLLDGVYAFDAGGLVGQFDTAGLWALAPHPSALNGYWSGLYPDAIDFSHANSLSIDAAGDVVVSFRHLHAVMKFRGGPTTPDFGQPVWTLTGSTSSILWPGDFTLTGAQFSGQHDAHFASDGSLLLFDNRFSAGGTARALRLQVDEGAGTAQSVESWDTGRACAIQGSVREVGDDVLVTCPTGGHVYEFAPGVPDPVWQAVAGCDGAASVGVSRAVPWDLWE